MKNHLTAAAVCLALCLGLSACSAFNYRDKSDASSIPLILDGEASPSGTASDNTPSSTPAVTPLPTFNPHATAAPGDSEKPADSTSVSAPSYDGLSADIKKAATELLLQFPTLYAPDEIYYGKLVEAFSPHEAAIIITGSSSLIDINSDGIPELFVYNNYYESGNMDMYIFKNGKYRFAERLDCGVFYGKSDGTVYFDPSNVAYGALEVYKVSLGENGLEKTCLYYYDGSPDNYINTFNNDTEKFGSERAYEYNELMAPALDPDCYELQQYEAETLKYELAKSSGDFFADKSSGTRVTVNCRKVPPSKVKFDAEGNVLLPMSILISPKIYTITASENNTYRVQNDYVDLSFSVGNDILLLFNEITQLPGKIEILDGEIYLPLEIMTDILSGFIAEPEGCNLLYVAGFSFDNTWSD